MAFNGKIAGAIRNAANGTPKNYAQVSNSFLKAAFDTPKRGYFTEGPMLKAKSMRLAGKSTVVGNTVFSFDKEGICKVIDQGNARLDFEVLIQQNGVQKVEDVVAAPAADAVVVAPVVVEQESSKVEDKPVVEPVKVDKRKKLTAK